ncbi:glucuronate isomerase [Vibrio artabrorum]|uniref:glucuronate isomerase n=1 Tax=Vibrio artabrorum TaxID=446374 RepID=UPI00355225B0
MASFLTENFLLSNDTAQQLYHEYAALQPIYDYHCHLDPKEIAENRRFDNISQIWLEGDHYKWRAMRCAGIEEELITGKASDYDKFIAWAHTVPKTLGNPLFHWTHLELRNPFGIKDMLLTPETADNLWHHCNELLATPEFSARGIMHAMNVKMVGTTDNPIDSLEHHRVIASDPSMTCKVLPSWRPDQAFKIELNGFSQYLKQLGDVTGIKITRFTELLQALDIRLLHFRAHGCRAADHGIETMRFADIPTESTLDTILSRRLNNESLTETEHAQFSTAVQVWLGKRYAHLGWVMQLHLGAQRDNNTRMLNLVGNNSGFDSIGDQNYAWELAHLLDEMDKTDELPRTILYCLNPRDNEMLATMIGNFQGGGIAGKVQFGSGWWFNDQKDGMRRQMEQLSQLGLISQFVGMLTDSRSFLSYTRHEYFRRILCNMIGQWAEHGEVPNDISLLGEMVKDICFTNAQRYFEQRD